MNLSFHIPPYSVSHLFWDWGKCVPTAIASADRRMATDGMKLANRANGVITWLLPTVDEGVEGLEARTAALLQRTVPGREEGTAATTGIPAIAFVGCPLTR